MGLFGLTAATWFKIAVVAASSAYQIEQARKARKAAKKAADARKGFELVVEGEATDVPIVYGRAKIGGIRVWHNTKSNHKGVSSTSGDIAFDVGAESSPGGEFRNPFTMTTRVFPPTSSGFLSQDQNGKNNDFLYFQQVLCMGPINAVYDFVVDESRYADDPSLGYSKTDPNDDIEGELIWKDVRAALRTEIHYDGGRNEMVSRNFSERSEAKFPGLAYANTVIRLDRDEPQFGAQVPMVQYFVEGRKVRKVNSGVLSGTRVYSNNPIWCLLDYLLMPEVSRQLLPNSGKNLTSEFINLDSFEEAANLAEMTVATNKMVSGNIWQTKSGLRNIETRNIPLYECNLIIDTTQPIRENIESILATMGDARLVWSNNQYKLSLQYPADNASITLADTITDDDLVMGSKVTIAWPSTEDKFNYATVRFSNESENFKEDTVSWPYKKSGTTFRGIGGVRYPLPADVDKLDLKEYAVWSGIPPGDSMAMTWKLKVPENGTYTFEVRARESGNVTVANVTAGTTLFIDVTSQEDLTSTSISMNTGDIYEVTMSASSSKREAFVTAALSKGGIIFWTTRDPAYTDFLTVTRDSSVYDTMKAEDNGLELETSVFLDGVTDYYHALAKAEEIVRTSRTAWKVEFTYLVKDSYLEPGDFIKLESATLGTANQPLYLRVEEVKLEETGESNIKASRFDWTQLAWNIDDNEFVTPPTIYNWEIPAPYALVYTPVQENILNSVGRLDWASIDFDFFAEFRVYVHYFGSFDSNGRPVFSEIGRTKETTFNIPALSGQAVIFGVKTFTTGGRSSAMVTTGVDAIDIGDMNDARSVEIVLDDETQGSVFVRESNATITPTSIAMTAITEGFIQPIFEWLIGGVLQVGETTANFILPSFSTTASKVVRCRVTEADTDIILDDTRTFFLLNDAQDRLQLIVENENVTLLADETGTLYEPLPLLIDTTLYQGSEIVTGDSYSITTTGTLSATIDAQGLIEITAIGENFSTINIEASYAGQVVFAKIRITIIQDGQVITSRIARVNADTMLFLTDEETLEVSPEKITVTSFSDGYITPYKAWYIDGVFFNDEVNSIDIAPFPVGEARTINLIVYEIAFNDPELETLREDSLTLYSVKSGTDAYTVFLTDENRTVPADNFGVVFDGYLPFTSQVKVFKGEQDVTTGFGIVYNIAENSGLNSTVNSNTGLVTVTGFDGDVDFGFSKITITTAVGKVFEKILTASKSVKGTTGDSIDIVFQRSVDSPVTPLPSEGTPLGWYTDVENVPDGPGFIWSSVGVRLGNAVMFYWNKPVRIEGSDGEGIAIAEISCYQRSWTAPSTPMGGCFDFQVNRLVIPPQDWFEQPPGGEAYVWRSMAVVSSAVHKCQGDPIPCNPGDEGYVEGAFEESYACSNYEVVEGPIEWSTPVIVFRDGEKGTDGTTDLISVDIGGVGDFLRNAGGSFIPAERVLFAIIRNIPEPSLAWEFEGAQITQSFASSVEVHPRDATVFEVRVLLTVTSAALTAPYVVERVMMVSYEGATGEAGQHGMMSVNASIYKWTPDITPPNRPSFNGVYFWGSGEYAAPTGWDTVAPSNTTPGHVLWSITVPITVIATTETSPLNWSQEQYPIRAIAVNGQQGPTGSVDNVGQYYIIDRNGSATSAPTEAEVQNEMGRDPNHNDIAIVRDLTTGDSRSFKYIVNNWAPIAKYISGSLIVENTITGDLIRAREIVGDHIATQTLTADHIDVNTITALGLIQAGHLRGLTIDTNAGSPRLEMTKTDGLRAINQNNQIVTKLAPDGSGWFAGGKITWSKWGTLTMPEAVIGDASVDTIHIRGQAVTFTVAGNFSNLSTGAAGSYNLGSVGLSSTGAPIVIQFGCSEMLGPGITSSEAGGSTVFYLREGSSTGTVLRSFTASAYKSTDDPLDREVWVGPSSARVRAPGPGLIRYYLTATITLSSVITNMYSNTYIRLPWIIAQEVKR